jgi:hypothetical protein
MVEAQKKWRHLNPILVILVYKYVKYSVIKLISLSLISLGITYLNFIIILKLKLQNKERIFQSSLGKSN